MIYVDTCRPSWIGSATFPKFLGTALTLGLTATAAIVAWRPSVPALASATVCGAALYGAGLYAGWEALHFIRSLRNEAAPAHRSAQTMWQLQRDLLDVRLTLLGGLAVAAVLAVALPGALRAGCATVCFLCAFGSALLERYMFFTASDAPRMPGGIA
jgi:DMSO reductase anchor subunit